jgi:succinoglycan biosynthesis transport protein ExoP
MIHPPPSRERATSPALPVAFAPLAKTIDALWASIVQSSGPTGMPERILFASARAGEGTTTLATCAAIGIAQHLRQRVVLLEANVHRPHLASCFGVVPVPGFSDVLHGRAGIDRAIRETEVLGLSVVPAGSTREAVAGELTSEQAQQILVEIGKLGRHLIVDSPPLLEHPDGSLLLRHVDAAVLVVDARTSRRDSIDAAKRLVDTGGVRLLGSVLNHYRPDASAWFEKRGWL